MSFIGRKVNEYTNGTSSTSYETIWDFSMPNSVYSIISISESGLRSKKIYDSLNRIIRIVNYGFNGELIYQDTTYGNEGQVASKSYPYKASLNLVDIDFIQYYYDYLLRETSRLEINFAKSKFLSYNTQYLTNNVIIYKDASGKSRKIRKNVVDKIITVTDHADSTSYYFYDAVHNLIKIKDPQKVETKFEYNLRNEITKKFDPYQGNFTYEYNSFSELIQSKHNEYVTSYKRDKLGRLVRKLEKDLETNWYFDTAKNGIGFLHSVNSSWLNKEISYDIFSRVVKTTTKLKSETNTEYSIIISYDNLGRVSSKTYPSDYKIFNCYNEFGFLSSISSDDSTCIKSFIWKANEYHVAFDNVLNEETQNGIKTEYAYNAYNQITKIRSSRKKVISSRDFHPMDMIIVIIYCKK